jgi:hypothetical protein
MKRRERAAATVTVVSQEPSLDGSRQRLIFSDGDLVGYNPYSGSLVVMLEGETYPRFVFAPYQPTTRASGVYHGLTESGRKQLEQLVQAIASAKAALLEFNRINQIDATIGKTLVDEAMMARTVAKPRRKR